MTFFCLDLFVLDSVLDYLFISRWMLLMESKQEEQANQVHLVNCLITVNINHLWSDDDGYIRLLNRFSLLRM